MAVGADSFDTDVGRLNECLETFPQANALGRSSKMFLILSPTCSLLDPRAAVAAAWHPVAGFHATQVDACYTLRKVFT